MARIPVSGRVAVDGRVAVSGRVARLGRVRQLIAGKNPFIWFDPDINAQQVGGKLVGIGNLANVGSGMTIPSGYAAAAYPSVTASGGRNHIDFDGGDTLNLTGGASVPAAISAATNLCFFYVGYWTTLGAAKNTVFSASTGSGGGADWVVIHADASVGTGVLFGMRDTASGKWGTTATGLISSGTPFLLTCWFDGSGVGNSGRMKVRINGVERTLTFTGTIPAQALTITAATGTIVMGQAPFIGSRELVGRVTFFAGYNVAIDYTNEVPAMEAKLNSKYSIY